MENPSLPLPNQAAPAAHGASQTAVSSLPQNGTGPVFEIDIQSHPLHGRSCGVGDKDRRPLNPAPILSLQVKENGKNLPPAELYTDSFVLRVELWNEEGTEAVVSHANIPTEKSILAGNIFSSSMVLRDQNGIPGIYFIFSDLSVRIHGTFRLKFYLYNMMEENGSLNRGKMTVITSIMSNPFTIYSSKSFPGTVMPSELVTAFIEQGIRMPNRKKGAWGDDDGSEEDD
ncbi:velvet factor-domain-containing protein, partial [Chytriomyces sp. MP71]